MLVQNLLKTGVERIQESEVVENFRETVFSRHDKAVARKNSQHEQDLGKL